MAGLRPVLLALALMLPGQGALAQEAAQETPAGAAQPVPVVLTLDQERFFNESAWGRAIGARAEAERQQLMAENRRIEEALQQEEQALTDRRALVPPAEFTRLAADFDTRVEGIRAAQEAKARALIEQRDAERRAFSAAAVPVLQLVLDESGASAILVSGAVIMATRAADITQTAIQRMDAAYPAPPPEEGAEGSPEGGGADDGADGAGDPAP